MVPQNAKSYGESTGDQIILVGVFGIGMGFLVTTIVAKIKSAKFTTISRKFEITYSIGWWESLNLHEQAILTGEIEKTAGKLRILHIERTRLLAKKTNRNPRTRVNARQNVPPLEDNVFMIPAKGWVLRSLIRYGLGRSGKATRVSWNRAKKLIYEKYKDDWSKLGGFPSRGSSIP